MNIIKNNVTLNINSDECEILVNACEMLNKIADTLNKENYHWLMFEESVDGDIEINTTNLREIADTIEKLTYCSRIEIY